MKIFLLSILLFTNSFAQITKEFETKIIDLFNKRDYKACIDEGVNYLTVHGDDSIKFYLNKAQTNLLNYDSSKSNQTEYFITKALEYVPNIIPDYAIYAGLGEVVFWMLYKSEYSISDKTIIFKFSARYFVEALLRIPKDSSEVFAQTYMKLSEISEYVEEYESAQKFILKAFEYTPNDYDIGMRVANLYEANDNIDSCNYVLERVYESNKDRTKAQNLYEFLGDFYVWRNENSAYYYEKALTEKGVDVSAIYEKLGSYYRFDNLDKSIEYYLKFIKINPNNDKVLLELASLYYTLDNKEEALKYYLRIKKWDSFSEWQKEYHQNRIGSIYYSESEYKKALKYYLNSKNNYDIASAYLMMSEYKNAIPYLKKNIEEIDQSEYWLDEAAKNNAFAHSYYWLGICYKEIGNRGEAYYAFANAVHYNSSDESSKFNMELYKILNENSSWEVVTTTNEFVHLCDRSRIERKNNIIKVWIKTPLFPVKIDINQMRRDYNKRYGDGTNKYENFNYALSLYEINCVSKKMRTLQVAEYDINGKPINAINYNSPDWEEIIPETVGEDIVDYMCSIKNK